MLKGLFPTDASKKSEEKVFMNYPKCKLSQCLVSSPKMKFGNTFKSNKETAFIHSTIIFGTGVYTGVYIAQNYQIDKVEDPKALFEKAQCYIKTKMDEFSKKGKD